MDMGGPIMDPGQEPSRRAHLLRKLVASLQESFLVIEKCPQPVIAAIHSGCVGGGVDMVCACDMRICSANAWFQVKVCVQLFLQYVSAIISKKGLCMRQLMFISHSCETES